MSAMNPPGFPTGGLGMPPSGPVPGGAPMSGMPLPGSAPQAPSKRKAPTRRVLGLQRSLAVGLAVVTIAVFALAGLGTTEDDAFVIRAAVSVAELNEITADMVEIVPVSSRFVEEGALAASDRATLETQAAGLLGQIARYPIARGQQLRPGMFSGPTGELVSLGADERLVSIPASLANAVAGTLRPGDRVDVIAVERREGIAGVIATNIEIVSIRLDADQLYNLSGEQTGPGGREIRPDELQPAEPIPGMYTLRVPVELMPLIAVASAMGELHLFYRGTGSTDLAPASVSLAEHLCRVTVEELRPQACQEYADVLDVFDQFESDQFDDDPFDGGDGTPAP
jgi:Flp pilus assembly protein CpaB